MNKNTKSCLLLRLAMIEGAVSLPISHRELIEKSTLVKRYFFNNNRDKILESMLSEISMVKENCCSNNNCLNLDSCSIFNDLFEKCIKKFGSELDGAIDAYNSGLFD